MTTEFTDLTFPYLGVAFVSQANPKLEVMQFSTLEGIRAFLSQPENIGCKWAFFEIAREISYRSEIRVTLEAGQ